MHTFFEKLICVIISHQFMKPFKCNVCNACFSRKADVKNHIESVHERKKPFKETFSQSHTLNEHIESVHEI